MLPVVLRRQACQERRMELFEAVRANPDDTGLRAQLAQAMQEVVEAVPALRPLEVEWGFVASPSPAAP
jgi:hypothetical protein